MPPRVLGVIVAVGLLVLAVGANGAAAAPVGSTRVLPGWPRNVGAGTVLPGPGGGVVVVSIGDPNATSNAIPFITTALRSDGRRLWVDHRVPACGNCDGGGQPVALQPDGTYGPIGYTGDDFWSLDAQGHEVTGCSGAVAADGTCVFVRPDPVAIGGTSPVMIARGPGGDLWTVTDVGFRWYPDNSEPPVVVHDDSGRLYAGLGYGTELPSGVTRRGRLIAVDPVTHAIVWTRPDPYGVLTALGSGVLAAGPSGFVSVGPDGSARWSLTSARRAAPSSTVYDATRDRLYIGTYPSGVTAVVASTGAEVWRSRPADGARLLSVGRSGRVYVSIRATGRRGVRALRLTDGSTAWGRRTGLPVLGALELANGSVAVSAGNPFAPTKADRLTLLRPR